LVSAKDQGVGKLAHEKRMDKRLFFALRIKRRKCLMLLAKIACDSP